MPFGVQGINNTFLTNKATVLQGIRNANALFVLTPPQHWYHPHTGTTWGFWRKILNHKGFSKVPDFGVVPVYRGDFGHFSYDFGHFS